MLRLRTSILIASAALLVAPLFGAQPAVADGAASTRNIIFGAAAAAAGTLLIINHNKKVHERYAEDARRQAYLAEQRDDAQAAYASERRAYDNEVALVQSYQHEVAVQHGEVVRERAQISSLQHQVALSGARSATVAAARPATVAAAPQAAPVAQGAVAPSSQVASVDTTPTGASYGWGTL